MSNSAPAAAGAETCRGLPATAVGTPGEPLDGTDGPDVLVSNGATYVDAKAGDDVVCVTGRSPVAYEDPTVDAGDGADIVDTTGSTAVRVHTSLGAGDDVFVGGDRPDVVWASDPWATPRGQGADTISSGGGRDYVSTGGGANADDDTIDLGRGADEVSIQGTVDPVHPVAGGSGRDQVEFERDTLRQALAIDNGAGTATAGDRVVATWDGFERFRLSPIGSWEPPTFVGGPGAESLWSAIPLTSVDLGAGDDLVDLELQSRDVVDHVSYAGGPGADAFILFAGAGDQARRVDLDVRAQRLRFAIFREVVRARISGFEKHRLSADQLRVRGTSGADHLEWSGCHGYVDGRTGDDLIRAVDIDDVGCGSFSLDRELVVHGNAGDDVLTGAWGHDILLGGPGRDTARGGRGPDRCVAEVERSC